MLPAINTAFSNAAAVDATPWIFATPFSTVTDKFFYTWIVFRDVLSHCFRRLFFFRENFLPMSLTKSNKPILKVPFVCFV